MSQFDRHVRAIAERQGWDTPDAVAALALRYVAAGDARMRLGFTDYLEEQARRENLARSASWEAPPVEQRRYGIRIEAEEMVGVLTLVPMEWLPDRCEWGEYGKEFTGLDWPLGMNDLVGEVVTTHEAVPTSEARVEVRRMLYEAYAAEAHG